MILFQCPGSCRLPHLPGHLKLDDQRRHQGVLLEQAHARQLQPVPRRKRNPELSQRFVLTAAADVDRPEGLGDRRLHVAAGGVVQSAAAADDVDVAASKKR